MTSTINYPTDPKTWSHERQIAQLKIEQANEEAQNAFSKLWRARQLMIEAGASAEGIAQVTRALHEASGWQPEEFMPDCPLDQRFGTYFDDRYVETSYIDADDLADAIADHGTHKQLKCVVIDTHDEDDLIGRTFSVRFSFWNDGRVGFLPKRPKGVQS